MQWRVDQIVWIRPFLVPRGEVVPKWGKGAIIEYEPRTQREGQIDILLDDAHESIKILCKELLVVCCLSQSKKLMVLSCALAMYSSIAFCAQYVFTLHTKIRGFSLIALITKGPLRQRHAMPLALPTSMARFEAVVAEKLNTVLATYQSSSLFTFTAHGLLQKDHLVVLAMSSGMSCYCARVAEDIVTACRDDVS